MGLMADDLWGISHEPQPNSTMIREDIRSHSNYPLTSTRCTAPTAWLRWTSLFPHGAKLKSLAIRHHDPSGVNKDAGGKRSRTHVTPIKTMVQTTTVSPRALGRHAVDISESRESVEARAPLQRSLRPLAKEANKGAPANKAPMFV